MNRSLRTALLAVSFLLLIVLSTPSLDFGGTLDSASTSYVEPVAPVAVAYELREKLALWVEAYFGERASLTAQGSYTFALDRPYLFDIDRLLLAFNFGTGSSATIGRFPVADFSGYILDHTLDGIHLLFNFPFGVMSASAGYSGLLLKPVSVIEMSLSDAADQAIESVHLAPMRLFESIQMTFPELFLRQDVSLSTVLQQDLRPADEIIQEGEETQYAGGLSGGRLNSQYFGLGLSGPVGSAAYQRLLFYLGTGKTLSYLEDGSSLSGYSYSYEPILSFLAAVGFSYFNEQARFSRIGFFALFSSGDADYTTFLEGNGAGKSLQFVPISRPTLGLIFSPQLGNFLLFELDYSFKPFSRTKSSTLRDIQTVFRAFTYFRPTTGPISEPGLDSGSDSPYLGSELDFVVNFRHFSDLGLAYSLGFFLPSPAAFTGSFDRAQVLNRLELSFSF